jgi:hypothetical protein
VLPLPVQAFAKDLLNIIILFLDPLPLTGYVTPSIPVRGFHSNYEKPISWIEVVDLWVDNPQG